MLWRWVGQATRWQITNRYSINQQSIANRWKYQSIKLPTNRSSKTNRWSIDNQNFKEGSIIYWLSEAIDNQSIDWSSIGHRLEKVIDCIEWESLVRINFPFLSWTFQSVSERWLVYFSETTNQRSENRKLPTWLTTWLSLKANTSWNAIFTSQNFYPQRWSADLSGQNLDCGNGVFSDCLPAWMHF